MLASDVDSCIYKSIIYAYLTKEKYDHSFAVIPRHCIIHFQGQGIAYVFSFYSDLQTNNFWPVHNHTVVSSPVVFSLSVFFFF